MIDGLDGKQFALQNGFVSSNLTTNTSLNIWSSWEAKNCQPNYRQNVLPDPSQSCGPYTPITEARNYRSAAAAAAVASAGLASRRSENGEVSSDYGLSPKLKPRKRLRPREHDTIGMVAIDQFGRMASGTSTNGLTYKVPGRVGDSPIAGAGSWVDSAVGGCGATGDGDIMM